MGLRPDSFALATVLFSPGARAQNTQVTSNTNIGTDAHDLWAEGNMIYVARGAAGVAIINATNQTAPVVVGNIRPYPTLNNIHIGDVQVVDGIAYIANEVPNNSSTPFTGVFIYDVQNPAAPVELGTITWGAGGGYHFGGNVHNLHVDKRGATVYLYVASITTSTVHVFDVTNPEAAVWLSEILPPLNSGFVWGQAHEIAVRGNLCATTWISGGFAIHDVTDPAAPVLLSHTPYASAFTYDATFTDDGYLLTTDGRSYIGMQIWNIANPSAPLRLSGFTITGGLMHNVRVKGNYAYLSCFEGGLRIVNIANRTVPLAAGGYDTRPTSAGTNAIGAWGVFAGANNIYVSDSVTGLYVIDHIDTIVVTRADWNNRTRTLVMEATSTGAPGAVLTAAGYGAMTYSPGLGRYTLTVGGVNPKPPSVTVTSDLGATASRSVRKE